MNTHRNLTLCALNSQNWSFLFVSFQRRRVITVKSQTAILVMPLPLLVRGHNWIIIIEGTFDSYRTLKASSPPDKSSFNAKEQTSSSTSPGLQRRGERWSFSAADAEVEVEPQGIHAGNSSPLQMLEQSESIDPACFPENTVEAR